MSAPNTLSEADILREIEQSLQPADKTPKVKIGQNEVPVDNPQALQTAIDAALQGNRQEFETLRATVEQLQRGRTVEPEVNNEPPVTRVETPPPARKRAPSNEEWSAEFIKDPQRVLDESFGRMLGVDALGSEAIRNILMGVGTGLQKQEAIANVLVQKQQELDTKITESLAVREAQAFIDSTPDYEINEGNKKVMQTYLEEYGLPATQKNLKLVYNQAKLDGKIAAPEQTQHQQFEQQTQAPLRRGVPRVGSQASTPVDEQYMLSRANELPIEEHGALIERLRSGQFSR